MKLKTKNQKDFRKKLSLLLILMTFLFIIEINLVSADRVGVVVNFPDGSVHGQCLEANKGTNGYDILQKLLVPVLWAGPSTFGHSLCKINNIGQEVSGDFCSFSGNKFWRFLILKDNKWESMPVGFDGGNKCWDEDSSSFSGHYCVKNKDVLGFDFVEWDNSFPAVYSFDKICNPIKLDVKVYVDGKKQKNVDELGGDIEIKQGSSVLFNIEIENDYIFDEVKIKDIKAEITIKNINNDRDIEKEVKFKDLDINENDEDKIEFSIPMTLEENEYELKLKITGSYKGIKQELVTEYALEVNKEKHNVMFSKLELENPETCYGQLNNLALEITNVGESNENILLSIKNPYLNLNLSDKFELKKNALYKKFVDFKVPKINAGDYDITVALDYYGQTKNEVTLTVKDCNENLKENSVQSNQKDNIQRLNLKKAIPSSEETYQKPFLEIHLVTILLGVFLFFLIASLILIATILNR